MKPRSFPAVVAALWVGFAAGAQAADLCAGLPRLEVTTPDGYCVGIVASHLSMPRGLAQLPNGDLLVTEMGGWTERKGRLTRLARSASGSVAETLASGLDRPHGVAIGPDGRIYVGEVGSVKRVAPSRPGSIESAIADLPARQRHPLTTFAFAPDGHLYINVGSSSDNCEASASDERTGALCPEARGPDAVGVVRVYRVSSTGAVSGGEVYARGLRNSVALAVHPSGTVLQAENSRDAIHLPLGLPNDDALPHDEINVLVAGRHYGWPYCYDRGVSAPEFPRYDCAAMMRPARLLPAHAAPLGMAWWSGPKAPAAWRDWLVIAYHGYRANGHRVVAFKVDARGVPVGGSVDLITGWGRRGDRGPGAPVSVLAGQDGALYLTDDRHGQVLRFSRAVAD